MEIGKIRKLVEEKKYSISKHAFIEAFEDGFGTKDILKAVDQGDVTERYPSRNRVLIYAKLGEKLIHVVVAYSIKYVWFVTVYQPDSNEWIDGKVRKQNDRA